MKILFVTGRQYVPDQHGGAQNTMHTCLEGLRARGQTCEAVTAMKRGLRYHGYRILHQLSRRRIAGLSDRLNGYRTYRTVHWHISRLVEQRVKAFRPDVIITDQFEMLEAIPDTVPCLLSVVDVEFVTRWVRLPDRSALRLFSNSHFTAGRVREHFGVDVPVLYPLIDFTHFRVERNSPEYITFINPIPAKGLEVALAVARLLPHRKFLFLEGWPLSDRALQELRRQLTDLSNVTFQRWTPDVSSVYARTDLLLAPSQCEEAFGRVVPEAQAGGIPVVASDRGGLPEAVGEGGRIVAHNAPAESWAETVESVLSDSVALAELSRRAEANTRRREFSRDYSIDRLLKLLQETAELRPTEADSVRVAS